jgi:hypothetical protein
VGRTVGLAVGWSHSKQSLAAGAATSPGRVPAEELAVSLLAIALAPKIVDSAGPFRQAVFPNPSCQSALAAVVSARNEFAHGGSDATGFLRAFLRLSVTWPYRVLYVTPPSSRRGEQFVLSDEEE